MKLIKPKFEILEQRPGISSIYRMIEIAGRTCYRSEDKITPDSAVAFVDRMIKSGHGAMLEHGTVYLIIPLSILIYLRNLIFLLYQILLKSIRIIHTLNGV